MKLSYKLILVILVSGLIIIMGIILSNTFIFEKREIEKNIRLSEFLVESMQERGDELLEKIEDNESLNGVLEELIQENDRVYFETIKSLNMAIETKDKYTAGHCDCVTDDAMTSDRAYRKALSVNDAIDELLRCKGTQFDPYLVDIFVNEIMMQKKDA